MTTQAGCAYEIAFLGPCGCPVADRGMCAKHAPWKCMSCKAPAVRECEASVGVCCGFPLCADCCHSPRKGHVTRQEAIRQTFEIEIEREQRTIDASRKTILASQERIAALEKRMDPT